MLFAADGAPGLLASLPRLSPQDVVEALPGKRALCLELTAEDFIGLTGLGGDVSPKEFNFLHLLLAFPTLWDAVVSSPARFRSVAKTTFFDRLVAPGEVLLRQGRKGSEVYVVRDGLLNVTQINDEKDFEFVLQVGRGQGLGEMARAAAHNRLVIGSRTATVMAEEASDLLGFDPYASGDQAMPEDVAGPIKVALTDKAEERWARGGRLLQAAPRLIRDAQALGIEIPLREAELVSSYCVPAWFAEGNTVVLEGDPVNPATSFLDIVFAGEVVVTRRAPHKTVSGRLGIGTVLCEGGFLGLVENRTATITIGRTPTILLRIEARYMPYFREEAPNFIAFLERLAARRQVGHVIRRGL
jgi:CRP-like cAMP-binding protein